MRAKFYGPSASALFLALTLAMLAWSGPAGADGDRNPRWAQPVELTGADNFYQVTPQLFRAAQPTAEAFRAYREFGIKTVINLRSMHSDRNLTAGTGLRLIETPIVTWDISDAEVITVLRLINESLEAGQGPILIHCQHGADRTGTIIAMYRIVFENWTRQEALDELVNGGYGYHSIWTNIPKYIQNVDIGKVKSALGRR